MTDTGRKGKAKFKVGRVVRVRRGYMHEGFYGQVIGIRQAKDGIEYWLSQLPGGWAIEFALRPLTKRERGA